MKDIRLHGEIQVVPGTEPSLRHRVEKNLKNSPCKHSVRYLILKGEALLSLSILYIGTHDYGYLSAHFNALISN